MRAAVLSIALVACRASQPAPPPSNRAPASSTEPVPAAVTTGGGAAIAKLQQLADAMCKCSDRDCADHVVDDMAQWAQDLARSGEVGPKVNDDEHEQARAATDRMSKCMSEVYRQRGGSGLRP